jgi:hypothetical protein
VTDWTNAPAGMISADKRNFPQYGPTTAANLGAVNYCKSWTVELADRLASYYRYPVFIMNEGVGGIRADNTLARMATSQWSNREAALRPNKFLIHLGTNDGIANRSASQFQKDVQGVINVLKNTYGASSNSIWLARPSYSSTYTNTANYLTAIDALRANNNLAGGPDLWGFYGANTARYYGSDPVHPNVAGMTEMARLWETSILSPAPTASLTVNKSDTPTDLKRDIAIKSGTTLDFKWSGKNATKYTSIYQVTQSNAANTCGPTGPAVWIANSSSGSTSFTYTSQYEGCTWVVVYSADGVVSDKITVTVVKSTPNSAAVINAVEWLMNWIRNGGSF